MALDTTTRSIRFPSDVDEDIRMAAQVLGVSINELVVAATSSYIARQRQTSKFKERLTAVMEKNRQALERLS